MGTKNISISEEAYQRLVSLKEPNESFTQVINRLTRRRSLLELAGVISDEEAEEISGSIDVLRREGVEGLRRRFMVAGVS